MKNNQYNTHLPLSSNRMFVLLLLVLLVTGLTYGRTHIHFQVAEPETLTTEEAEALQIAPGSEGFWDPSPHIIAEMENIQEMIGDTYNEISQLETKLDRYYNSGGILPHKQEKLQEDLEKAQYDLEAAEKELTKWAIVLARVNAKISQEKEESVAEATELPGNTFQTNEEAELQTTESADYDGYAYGFSKMFR